MPLYGMDIALTRKSISGITSYSHLPTNMAFVGPAYGSLAANKAKIAAKRDPVLDREAQEWIEAVIGENFPNGSYEDVLKDGIILCKLMNKLQPGSIPKFSTTGSSFKLRENISLFQNAARTYGLNESELFQTVDLFEKHNIPQVTQCIFALGRNAQRKKFNGPILGPKMSDSNIREFTDTQLRSGEGTLGLLNDGMSKGDQFQLTNLSSISINSSQIEKCENKDKSTARLARIDTASTSSDVSDVSMMIDDRKRVRSQQRTLSNTSLNNLLTNLKTIEISPSAQATLNHEREEEAINHLQLLIDLARDTDSSRHDKQHRLYKYLEDSIGMVELLSLLRFIKSSSSQININEAPLNLYSSILPTLTVLLMLDNDI